MPIEIDWEVTDAPRASTPVEAEAGRAWDPNGLRPSLPPARPEPPAPPAPPQPPTKNRRRPGWVIPLVAMLMLAGLSAGSLWYLSRAGWQRVSDDVAALVRYEDQMSRRGEAALVMNVQDPSNVDWLVARRTQVDEALPAPLPVPILEQTSANPAIGEVEALDADFVVVPVERAYRAADGTLAAFTLPQIYLRDAEGDWQHTAPPGHFWGNWQDWRSEVLFVRHSERDAELVEALAPRLEGWLRSACQGWGANCPAAKLYLSGFVGSLEYDPLDNIEVRVEFGTDAVALPPDYFLSVPSPQINGVPSNAAAQDLLAEYLAVRLIASLAESVSETPHQATTLAAQAIESLGLGRADPGFAALARQQAQIEAEAEPEVVMANARPTAEAGQGSAEQPCLIQREYNIQAGDTLGGIAANFRVAVSELMRCNDLDSPDVIFAGEKLLIPISTSAEAPAP